MTPLQFDTLTIPAASGSGASLVASTKRSNLGGSFFFCKAASAQFRMQFDAGTVFPCEAGFFSNGVVASWDSITFYNYNPYPITIVYYVGQNGIGYSGTILSKNLDTYTLGNVGLGADTIQVNNTNFPSGLKVPGLNNGNKRKAIIVTCYAGLGNAAPLLIRNAAGQTVMYVPLGATMIFETSDNFVLVCQTPGLNAWVTIGELYYSA